MQQEEEVEIKNSANIVANQDIKQMLALSKPKISLVDIVIKSVMSKKSVDLEKQVEKQQRKKLMTRKTNLTINQLKKKTLLVRQGDQVELKERTEEESTT